MKILITHYDKGNAENINIMHIELCRSKIYKNTNENIKSTYLLKST